jgi:hypothetical protein
MQFVSRVKLRGKNDVGNSMSSSSKSDSDQSIFQGYCNHDLKEKKVKTKTFDGKNFKSTAKK